MLRLKSGLVIVGACALALSACGDKTETTKTTTTTTTAAAGAPIDANSLPKRKPGLWQQTATMAAGGPAMTSKICLDEATDAKMSVLGEQMSKDACPDTKITQNGASYIVNATCNMGTGGTVVTQAVTTGDFQNSYDMDVSTTTTGAAAPQMNGSGKMKMSAKWLGPCPAGMAPGDIEMANGMTINMSNFDPAKAKAAAGQ